jgi:EAL domain-containing protein (putative c-di-GMP-specific phosphodiesterase class I)
MTGELDVLCRENVVNSLASFDATKKLFLNVLPITILDQDRRKFFKRLLNETHLGPDSVVLEIAERASVADLSLFRRRLDQVRELGFLVALDDIGTGYSSLQAISEIAPDFLKIDISLTRDIHKSLIKQELMLTLTDMAARLSARVVAEGIEAEEEREALVERGVELGQGFLLGEPVPLPEETTQA